MRVRESESHASQHSFQRARNKLSAISTDLFAFSNSGISQLLSYSAKQHIWTEFDSLQELKTQQRSEHSEAHKMINVKDVIGKGR